MTSAPNREISNRAEAEAINSIAQQANPMGIGHKEFFLIQFTAASKVVRTTFPSTLEL
jgi:hypothetical protein